MSAKSYALTILLGNQEDLTFWAERGSEKCLKLPGFCHFSLFSSSYLEAWKWFVDSVIDREDGKSGLDCFHLFATLDQPSQAFSRSQMIWSDISWSAASQKLKKPSSCHLTTLMKSKLVLKVFHYLTLVFGIMETEFQLNWEHLSKNIVVLFVTGMWTGDKILCLREFVKVDRNHVEDDNDEEGDAKADTVGWGWGQQ